MHKSARILLEYKQSAVLVSASIYEIEWVRQTGVQLYITVTKIIIENSEFSLENISIYWKFLIDIPKVQNKSNETLIESESNLHNS